MRRLGTTLLAVFLSFGVLTELPAKGAEVFASPNVEPVARYQWRSEGTQFGTDLEFATIAGRDYAFAGTLNQGMRIVDITDPRRPRAAGVFDCSVGQGDIQVFRQGARWLATFTADNGYSNGGTCYRRLGVTRGTPGTFIADVSDPTSPKAVGFVNVPLGSHNMTVHPNGRFLYNSDSELPGKGQVEVWDISNPAKPKLGKIVDLVPSLAVTNDLPSSSHDITFNADGSRAYVAALSYTVILDSTAAGSPTVLSRIADPAITLHHQSDPVVFQTPAGPLTFLVVTDELGGGATNVCPGGGLHVYNVTGPLELAPVKMGAFFAPFAGEPPSGACTSHVLRMHPDEGIMTIGWYGLGSRVIDISGLVGLALGVEEDVVGTAGVGMREVGFLRFDDGNTWTAKTNRIAPDGSFFLYANDLNRGLDILRYTPPTDEMLAGGPGGIDPGRWLSPAEALTESRARATAATGTSAPYCVILPTRL